jgi:predicted GNAT family N-acyltransferase
MLKLGSTLFYDARIDDSSILLQDAHGRSPRIQAMEIEIRPAMTERDVAGALNLRRLVFVVEQGVPAELEHDEADAAAIHVVAVQDGTVVATGRLLLAQPGSARIGRMAVASHLRRRGLGSRVLDCLEQQARLQGSHELLLHAQTPVRDFYAGLGYKVQGEEFMEAGIRHITMAKRL